jgi:hypothetical protein
MLAGENGATGYLLKALRLSLTCQDVRFYYQPQDTDLPHGKGT